MAGICAKFEKKTGWYIIFKGITLTEERNFSQGTFNTIFYQAIMSEKRARRFLETRGNEVRTPFSLDLYSLILDNLLIIQLSPCLVK